MNRGFKSPYGIGFAAPNDPRLSSPRIIASQQQANPLLNSPSIVCGSPSRSGRNPIPLPYHISIPTPLSAVSLTLSPDSPRQQKHKDPWPSSLPSVSSDTEGYNSTRIDIQEQHLQHQQRSQATKSAATLSPSETTFNSFTTSNATTPFIRAAATSHAAIPSHATLNQKVNARSKLDPMTTPNPLLVSNSDGRAQDDDIQSVIVIDHKPQQNNASKNLASTEPDLSQSSSSLPKHNNINDQINNNSINDTEKQKQQKPQSSSQSIINNINTSPRKQATGNPVDIAKTDVNSCNHNGADNIKPSFLRMKSRPKKNDRAGALPSNEALNKVDEQPRGSPADPDEEKFSTPPSQPGQSVIDKPQSVNKLQNQRPQQSQPHPHQHPEQQPNLQTQQKMQSQVQQSEQQLQKQSQLKQQDSNPCKGTPTSFSTPNLNLSTSSDKNQMKPPRGSIYFTGSKPSSSSYIETPFSWEVYLKIKPAEAAPREAFMQSMKPMQNSFKIGMKLEARDPRNTHSWCLASVVHIEGLRLKLRFEGSDNTNDFFELVDSDNIRSIGSRPDDILLPPTAFRGNLSTYPKFVEKTLSRPDSVIAPPELFYDKPARPAKNLFKVGMKLEAIDKKNPQLICPATIGEVNGAEIKIIFDGWKGPFDYRCDYYSRDIFPINWCRDTNHFIMCPKGWDQLLSNKSDPTKPTINSPNRTILLSVSPPLRPHTTQSPAKVQGGAKMKKTKSKKKKDVASSTPKMSPSPLLSPVEKYDQPPTDNDTTPEDYIEDIKDLEKISCQRATSIDVWRKSKQQDAVSSSNLVRSGPSPPPSKKAKRKGFWDSESDDGSDASTKDLKHVNFPEDVILTTGKSLADTNKPIASESSAYRHPSDSEIFKALPTKPTDWSVGNVLTLIKADETLAKYSNIFECHEIDGKAFILLTNDVMIKHMGLKIGPVLKIHDLIEQVKKLN